jgi:hypothetical protein
MGLNEGGLRFQGGCTGGSGGGSGIPGERLGFVGEDVDGKMRCVWISMGYVLGNWMVGWEEIEWRVIGM